MPITVLDYAASVIPGRQFYTAQGQPANRIEIFGPPRTCQSCHNTIDPGNTYPSTTGSWRCADCIGDTGYATATGYADALARELLAGFLRGLADHLQHNTIPGAPRYTATVTVQIHPTDPVAPAEINQTAELIDAPPHDTTSQDDAYGTARGTLAASMHLSAPMPVCYQATPDPGPDTEPPQRRKLAMPITILDYVKSVVGDKDLYTAEDCLAAGVDILGGCQGCQATIACYNAYPSKTGYWRCADCIGDTGFATTAEFTASMSGTTRCPSCGNADTISETRITHERSEEYALECECGEVWQP